MLSFCSSLCITVQQSSFRSRKAKSATLDLRKVKNNGEGVMKEPKKAVDSSLRRRPPSRANPTQN
ncbi:hypothetical protein SOVF_211520, partial [Spinacia oleracea]